MAGLQLVTFSKRRLQHRFFPVNLTKFLRTSSFIEHFPWLLLGCVSVFAYGVIQCQVWQKWRKSVESFQLAKMDKKLVINLTFCKSIHLIWLETKEFFLIKIYLTQILKELYSIYWRKRYTLMKISQYVFNHVIKSLKQSHFPA